MENNVPYIVHESALARAERHTRRLIWALIAALIALGVTNGIWIVSTAIH